MSKTWYPIINEQLCIGCLSCVAFCPHGVYEEYDGKPRVIHPENCIEHCHGCELHACTSGAISYFGDTVKSLDGPSPAVGCMPMDDSGHS